MQLPPRRSRPRVASTDRTQHDGAQRASSRLIDLYAGRGLDRPGEAVPELVVLRAARWSCPGSCD